MENNQSETEKVVNKAQKFGNKLLKSKLLKTALIILLVTMALISYLKIILKNDTADKSSKANEIYIIGENYTKYEIC